MELLYYSVASSYQQPYPTPYPTPPGSTPYPTGASPVTQFPQQPQQPTQVAPVAASEPDPEKGKTLVQNCCIILI